MGIFVSPAGAGRRSGGMAKVPLATLMTTLVLVTCVASQAAAPWWEQQARIIPSPRSYSGQFGKVVSLDGDTAIIGATESAFIFNRQGSAWVQQASLIHTSPVSGDEFGISVSVSGDTAVIGADWGRRQYAPWAGSVYIYERSGTTWTQAAMLNTPVSGNNQLFGYATAIEGDTLVVGAPWSCHAYVYQREQSGWSLTASLTGSLLNEWYGGSISLSGDTLVIGAADASQGPIVGSGAAYVYRREGTSWSLVTRISNPHPGTYAEFGQSVSVSGDDLVIGSPGDNYGSGIPPGAAYFYEYDGTAWTSSTKYTVTDPNVYTVGQSVAVSDGKAIVGAGADRSGATWTGAAYILYKGDSGWSPVASLGNGLQYADFGRAVAISGDTYLVGAKNELLNPSDPYSNAGAAYVFTPEPASLTVLALGGLALVRRRR